MSILIQGGRIAGRGSDEVTDLLIEGEKIIAIGNLTEEMIKEADQVIEAQGYILFPGFIDAHTHLDMDTGTAHTSDDFESGTQAALKGGTTTIIDFATQNKGESLKEALKNWHEKAEEKSACDYGFHMAITDWNEEVCKELGEMKKEGVTSFKLYMAYDALRVRDQEIYEVLQAVTALGGIVGVHCENGDLVNELIKKELIAGHTSPKAHPLSRPEVVEKEAISRFLDIAYVAETPAHVVHLSTKLGLEVVRKARARGQQVFVESCPQYLLLDDHHYDLEGFESAKYVLSPPLRSLVDMEALWNAMEQDEIQTISTDHCAFNFAEQKALGKDDFSKIPCGMPGIEHRPQLIYTYGVKIGKISEKHMTELLSTNAAKLFGLYPQKGILRVGSDADIVIWNPDYEGTITAKDQLQKVDYTPYEGFKVKGRAERVLLRGQVVVQDGAVVDETKGRYVKRTVSLI